MHLRSLTYEAHSGENMSTIQSMLSALSTQLRRISLTLPVFQEKWLSQIGRMLVENDCEIFLRFETGFYYHEEEEHQCISVRSLLCFRGLKCLHFELEDYIVLHIEDLIKLPNLHAVFFSSLHIDAGSVVKLSRCSKSITNLSFFSCKHIENSSRIENYRRQRYINIDDIKTGRILNPQGDVGLYENAESLSVRLDDLDSPPL